MPRLICLRWVQSFCWFCHEAAHLCYYHKNWKFGTLEIVLVIILKSEEGGFIMQDFNAFKRRPWSDCSWRIILVCICIVCSDLTILSQTSLYCPSTNLKTFEPSHDKSKKMTVRPAKSQVSLGIRPVWLESSLSAWRNLGSFAILRVHSEDSDQTGHMPRLI